jgi:hypothetical protein
VRLRGLAGLAALRVAVRERERLAGERAAREHAAQPGTSARGSTLPTPSAR